MSLAATPSQTIGPFFAIMLRLGSNELVQADHPGAIELEGRVLDGAGAPVSDALIEVWQANAAGRYAHPEDDRELLLAPGFTGFGRCATDIEGRFGFRTVKPGLVPALDSAWQAPHINVTVFARGLLHRVVTRIYFPDEPDANVADPLLRSIDDPTVRQTLVAAAAGPAAYHFDIRLQGDGETAFLAI